MDEIKLVDLRKETVNTVKEAIKIASSMGAAGFKLFVNPNFVKMGLVSTRIVPVSAEPPPKTQLLLNFSGLKNLKQTLEFAKKMLGDAGEVEVAEKVSDVTLTTPLAEEADAHVAEPMEKAAEAVAATEEALVDEISIDAESDADVEDESVLEEELAEVPAAIAKSAKRGKKKKKSVEEGEE